MAGDVVLHEPPGDDGLLHHVVDYDLANVDHRVPDNVGRGSCNKDRTNERTARLDSSEARTLRSRNYAMCGIDGFFLLGTLYWANGFRPNLHGLR